MKPIFPPRPEQQKAFETAREILATKGRVAMVAPTGSGKCLGRDTPVMRYDGEVVPVQDVRVGDLLMGPDSKPRKVLGTTSGRGPLYRVTPVKGDSYVVNAAHVLSLKLSPTVKGDEPELVNVSVEDYLTRSDTFKHRAKGWRAAVDFPSRPVAIDPYFLGLWLADGTSKCPSITKPDPEVEATVRAYAKTFGLGVRVSYNDSGCPCYHINGGRQGKRVNPNPLLTLMRDAGVIGNKHAPRDYLINDREVRLNLLAGLLDGDGYMQCGGYDFSSTNRRIADAVVFLARSLGLAAYLTPRTTHSQNGTACDSFRVSVSGDCSVIPCRIARRKAPPRKQLRDVTATGITVEPIGDGEYFGFQLDGDHLFLLGDFTVTHNSLVEALLLIDGVTVAAPSMDICDGIARAASLATTGTEAARRRRYEAAGLYTYKRLHTALAAGKLAPQRLALDEGHHATSATLQEVIAMCPGAGVALITATMYRGTPDETAKLLALVNNTVVHVLTLHAAVTQGRISLPTFDVLPLMDDELIDVTGGEFNVRSSEALASSVRDALVATILADLWDEAAGMWKRPATLVLPGVASVEEFQAAFGDKAVSVLGDTRNRRELFDRVLARKHLLLQVRAVGEGTDLPLRVMYDAAPTMSPTLWMQRVGRICRPVGCYCTRCDCRIPRPLEMPGLVPPKEQSCPGCLQRGMLVTEAPPRYVTTCHNLLRHGYLFEGLVPRAAFAQAVSVWGDEFKPSRRTVARAMGLTGFGRFEPTSVRLATGETAFLYALTNKGGTVDAAALLVPAAPEPLYFTRTNRGTGQFEEFQPRPGVTVRYERKLYGTWARVDKLPDLTDCASFKPKPLTPPQRDWWQNAAEKKGLDPDPTALTAKEFCVLPILTDARLRIDTASL